MREIINEINLFIKFLLVSRITIWNWYHSKFDFKGIFKKVESDVVLTIVSKMHLLSFGMLTHVIAM